MGKLWETYNFPDGKNDDRWYHWCIENWEPSGKQICYRNLRYKIMTHSKLSFNTAWSPPEGVVEKLREKFPELTFQCFYDEPDAEISKGTIKWHL